ncbi:hypothetical protein TM7_0149 [candidate division TM7 genomosp. GTL1]|nr:hypothetical protein TM7_0149 [candidate division TM7 genomosp. GTL1]
MRGKTTIVINGRHYDGTTGLPVEKDEQRHSVNDVMFSKPAAKFAHPQAPPVAAEEPKPARSHAPATAIHSSLERSHTLVRSAVKRPTPKHPAQHSRVHANVAKSPHITKFARHPEPIKKKVAVSPRSDVVLHHRQPAHAQPTMPTKQVSSRAIKEHLINQQLATAQPNLHEEPQPEERKSRSRMASLATAGLALVLLGGYLTYLNMPVLSIRVAAAQAGIDATLPEYQPDGYRFNGPVSYSHGEIDMTYSANAGPQSYSISQKASDWDSQAVLDNYVLKESNGEYSIHSTGGLTVYTFGTKAAWVNNGILHSIDYSNAPLSYSQIERIASSM